MDKIGFQQSFETKDHEKVKAILNEYRDNTKDIIDSRVDLLLLAKSKPVPERNALLAIEALSSVFVLRKSPNSSLHPSLNPAPLSKDEWKWDNTSSVKCLQLQSKGIRMNKAILTYLLNLPFNEADGDRVFTVRIDWAAKPVSTLMMPSYFDELLSFEETLNYLYAWCNHHLCLKEIMLPALRKCKQEVSFSSVLETPISADDGSSPNIYLTQSRCRRNQASATTDPDLEDLNNDEQ
ncbi:hypothetical protein AB4K20DRAFT_1957254 [Rhizopus microsporus]